MDFGSINPAVLIASLMVAAVPIMLAALGELIVEKSGVLNLGVEGMMIIGAIAGFITAVNTGSPVIGFIGGAAAGAALSLVFAFLTQFLLTNQVATGLALTLFGLGLSSLAGQGYNGIKPPPTGAVPFGPLADIPFFGRVLFAHDWMVYFSILMVAVTWYVLKSTRLGLIIRAVGENHEAAHSLGYKVTRIRIGCIMFGGAMAGMGGAYISLVRVPQWVDGITSGAGWIALAIVVFASWRPWRVLIGAYLFGGITVLQLNLQAAGSAIPVEYLSMAPYLVTILVLVIMSSGRGKASLNAPASLGQNFHASH
ncbi:MAG: ABC transporter permease [Paracoccaceae bacterium]